MKTKVCLIAIVKDEAHVIERMLRSVLPVIDYWVIADTGSSDQTREIIREVLKDVPGELHEDEWVHFAHNRTLCIKRAFGKGDYLLSMDADHTFHGQIPEGLDYVGYAIEHRYDGLKYGLPCLMRGDVHWHYECPIHETVVGENIGEQPFKGIHGDLCHIKVFHEGARAKDPKTYEKDAAMLQKYVDEHPGEPRATYYLAQSYFCAGDMPNARKWYATRMRQENGWWEEQWHAHYRYAQTAQNLKLDFAIVMAEFLSAYQANPTRCEPLIALARYARLEGHHAIALMASRQAITIPKPHAGHIFVEEGPYDWLAEDEFSVACFWAGDAREGLKACRRLLLNPNMPESNRKRVEDNIKFFTDKLQKAA